MLILGLNAFHPDSSACLVVDGKLTAAVEEERFRRIKHWAGFPSLAVEYCLREANAELDDIDYIAINRDPKANLHKKAIYTLLHMPRVSLVKARLANMNKIGNITQFLEPMSGDKKVDLGTKVSHVEHHRAHLASTYFVSPFESATVVSVDGFGDFTSCMVAKGQGNRLEVLYEVNYPHSLGMFYTALTQFLGFKKFGDEYKVMGLSAYGQPLYKDEMARMVRTIPGGWFKLNLKYFSFHRHRESMTWDNTEPVLEDAFSHEVESALGPRRRTEDEIEQRHCDIAASMQAAYEETFFNILNHAYNTTGIPRLCLAGGCALNSLANGKIFDRTPFEEIYIQPASSDAGGSLGACYFLWHQVLGKPRDFVMEHAYWGPGYSDESIQSALKARKEDLEGFEIVKTRDDDELCNETARHISNGKIVGWFQGRMEWGPRALGNRSLLVDPRRAEMKDILNERIKRREWFRPFAPSILEERVGEYFEKDYPDPFMIKVYPIRVDKRHLIPAVTHVDGTGRLQTVNRKENPLYWKLIKAFDDLTGVPVLLNTSFNENEPIVCTPHEAIDCFLRTRMDVLAIGHFLIVRKN